MAESIKEQPDYTSDGVNTDKIEEKSEKTMRHFTKFDRDEQILTMDHRPWSYLNAVLDRYSYFSDSSIHLSLLEDSEDLSLREELLGPYREWKIQLQESVFFKEIYCGVYCVKFSDDGEMLAMGFGSGAVKILDNNKKVIRIINGYEGNAGVTNIRFNAKQPEFFYACSESGIIYLCSVHGDYSSFSSEKNNEILSIDTDYKGQYLVSAGKDATIRVYETDTNLLLKEYCKDDNHMFHNMRIYALKWQPENTSVIISGSIDNTVKVWDIRTADGCVGTMYGPHIFGNAIDIKDHTILTGSWHGKYGLQLWHLPSRKLLKTIKPKNKPLCIDDDYLMTAKFFKGQPDGDLILCGGSGLPSLQVISIQEEAIIHEAPETRHVVDVDSFDKLIAFGGMGHIVSLMSLESTKTLYTIYTISNGRYMNKMKTLRSKILKFPGLIKFPKMSHPCIGLIQGESGGNFKFIET